MEIMMVISPLDTYIHMYIIGKYNHLVRITSLAFHTTDVVYVNFIYEWRDLQFNFDSERQIFWETFHGRFILYPEFLPEICWEEKADQIFFFIFRFDVWPGIWNRALRLLSQYSTY